MAHQSHSLVNHFGLHERVIIDFILVVGVQLAVFFFKYGDLYAIGKVQVQLMLSYHLLNAIVYLLLFGLGIEFH